MVGRKPKDTPRKLRVKNIYLPEPVRDKIALIVENVTNSAMDVYVQAVRSYFGVPGQRDEYLSWAKFDCSQLGLPWEDYVQGIENGLIGAPVRVPHLPALIGGVAPIQHADGAVTINSMILPLQTIFYVKLACRRHSTSISKFVSSCIVWHIGKYWTTSYAPLLKPIEELGNIEVQPWTIYLEDFQNDPEK